MTELLDVNLLVSLAWPNHVHHSLAHAWFRERGSRGWATTPITEAGFVRVSSNRATIPTAVTPAEALTLLRTMRTVPGHVFLPDDVELLVGEAPIDFNRVVGHRLVTDAHLLALARRHGATLATFDRGIHGMSSPENMDITLVPLR